MKTPAFWARDGVLPRLLAPFCLFYRAGAIVHQSIVTPRDAGIPVICVGNIVAGGAGKTPVALALASHLTSRGKPTAFLSRGHGGDLIGPVKVDPKTHRPRDVGDEALLLAEAGPTWVSHDRASGAEAARDNGAELIIMDDGFQNFGLKKTLSLVVIDGGFGFGNRRIHPAGPLREPVDSGLARADAVVMIGEDMTDIAPFLPSGLPLLRAEIAPVPNPRLAPGTRVLGFAGIGRPEKFRETLESLRLEVTEFEAFADHHAFSVSEVEALLDRASRNGAIAVTTAKDHVRLPGKAREKIERLDISLRWRDEAMLSAVLDKGLSHGPG